MILNKSSLILVFIFIHFFLLIIGCSGVEDYSNKKQIDFNFKDSIKINSQSYEKDSANNVLRIAISAISSPRETFVYYEEMFQYIEKQMGMKVQMIQRKTYEEVNTLLKTNQVDLAFVCSGGYVYGKDDSAFELLATSERNGSRKYFAYIITHNNSGISQFEDLKGKRFAFTDPLSTSGMLYPLKRLKEFKSSPANFFSVFSFTYAHDNSIQLVAKQLVDGAAVNSLVFEYLAENSPDRTKNIRIIEKSEWYGMPPIVVAKGVPKELKEKLAMVFLNIHKDKGSDKVLRKLMVDRYVNDSDTLYKSVRDMIYFINN